MQKTLLLLFFFLLNGCSLNSILALGEVDKVQLVKKNTYLSHYRAYFTRTQLKPIKKNQKYLYFYNKKKKDLALLLHSHDKYYLYSLYHPAIGKITINTHKRTSYKDIVRTLKRQGYLASSPHAVGATSKVALRRYKGIKTLLVEIKDYSTLQTKYQTAIKTYDASKVKNIKTLLPHVLIANYFNTYQKQATTSIQKEQLERIANKLHLNTPEIKQVKQEIKQVMQEEEAVQAVLAKEVPEPIIIDEPSSFDYYAQEASYYELDNYLTDSASKDKLSFNQYTQLNKRHAQLKEAKILKEGSLEELISLYKTNKNPKYKSRILELMKEAQK
jgi:hypothetical protein